MSEKFIKIDKEFQLSDSTLNVYSFRLLTSGFQLSDFARNPIGYYLHERESGVLVKWTDLAVKGDKIVGKPTINLHHPRGQQTADEINNGFLNAASMGKLVALELSTSPDLMLPDQLGPTVTKWFPRECSLVDIPGNFNSLAELCDADGTVINLADFTKKTTMKDIKLTAGQLALINLKDDATDDVVTATLQNLVDKAKQTDTLTAEKAAVVKELSDLKDATTASEVTALLDKGLADKKITAAAKEKLAVSYQGKPAELKDLIDALPVHVSISKKLDADGKKLADLAAQDWDALDKAGKLEDLKATDFETFKEKYKEKFGGEYKG
jgi:hypothetical protein